MSSATALVLYLIQAVVSALTAAGVVILGQRVIDRRAGLAAGWIWALHPTAIWYSVGHVWDTSLTAGALVGFLILFLAWGRRCSPVRSLGSGSLFGLLLLLSPAPIGILPVLLIYLAPAGDRAPSVRRVLLFLLGMGLACLPWMLRNHSQVGTLGLRSNLMVELRVGNNELANGWHQKSLHPGWSPEEGAELKRLGEPLYAERCGELALDWIRSHPDLFLELCAVRFTLIWFGAPPTLDPRSQGGMDAARDPRSWLRWITFMLTGVIGVLGLYSTKRRGPDAVLLLATVLLFVVPYYVTHSLERYRFPIEPLLILGCGVALASASRAWLRRPREPQADAGPSG